MNKDIIYIDVEDDITAIIGKIKSSKENIVAVVPPKRVGVLQSAVNLRLLVRAADNANKRLVLITNNQALIALSAAANIPVAKNLQSKPEIAEISALEVDEGEDIIDGSLLPVGELEKTADLPQDDDTAIGSVIAGLEPSPKESTTIPIKTAVAAPRPVRGKDGNKNAIKVPNFNKFRKRLFISIAALVLLVCFFVWAIWFAPAAKVIITARTTSASVNTNVTLAGNAASDVSKGTIQSVSKQIKKEASVEFDATGQKDVGTKASGSVQFSTGSIANLGKTIPAGTALTSASGLIYYTDEAVTFTLSNYGGVTVGIQAAETGEKYNAASGSMSGAPSGVSASITNATAGGTTKIVAVVTDSDVAAATEKLTQQSSDEIKAELKKQFVSGEVVIEDSFIIDNGAPASTPAVGAEATTKAKLVSQSTYTISAVAKSDLEIYLKATLEKQIASTKDQRIYDTGIGSVRLTGFIKETNSVTIVGTGQVGPKIDDVAVKEQVEGKRYGEVQESLEAIQGVDSVDVKFSFFWVRTVPNDINKISVEFKLQND